MCQPIKRLAYYLWRYPMLSETFIQREITALKQSGMPVEVISDVPDNLKVLDEKTRFHANYTTYLFPIRIPSLFKYLARFCLKNPITLINSFFYIVSTRYQHHKSLKEDLRIFLKAVYLAGILQDKKITHAHCPWSDVNSFILLVVSKITSVTYSVQVRAHDVHRKIAAYALREKFSNAEFVITNCHYNKKFVQTLLHKQYRHKIHSIYEGLDLVQFQFTPVKKHVPNRIRLLTVARIIEQKGFIYLLKACKRLKDEGIPFQCEIIGDAEKPLYTDYYNSIMGLHRQLSLEDRVFFLGPQPFSKVFKALQNSDIFVLPCVLPEDGSRDITPNSIMEAMAMKLPVITTPVTGIPEIVDDGINGIMIPMNDEKALVEAIIKLMNDSKLRKQLGENARKKIEDRFDITKNIESYIELFNGALH